MKFKDKRQEEISIDLTPFIDVVFMLLLFFVVSTSLFKGATQLDVDLPQANAKPLAPHAQVEVVINNEGSYFIEGAAIGSDTKLLKTALQAKMQENESSILVVAGDKQAPHQAVVSALEVAGELGVKRVQIVAQKRSEKHEKNKSS